MSRNRLYDFFVEPIIFVKEQMDLFGFILATAVFIWGWFHQVKVVHDSILLGAFGALSYAFSVVCFYTILKAALASLWKHPGSRGSLTRIVEQSIAGVVSALLALIVAHILGF